jgi:hypothetical protein
MLCLIYVKLLWYALTSSHVEMARAMCPTRITLANSDDDDDDDYAAVFWRYTCTYLRHKLRLTNFINNMDKSFPILAPINCTPRRPRTGSSCRYSSREDHGPETGKHLIPDAKSGAKKALKKIYLYKYTQPPFLSMLFRDFRSVRRWGRGSNASATPSRRCFH